MTSPLLPVLACQGSSIPTSRPAATIAKACRQQTSSSEQALSSGGRRPASHGVRLSGSSPGCPYPIGRCTCTMPPDAPPPPGIPAWQGLPVMMGRFWLGCPRDCQQVGHSCCAGWHMEQAAGARCTRGPHLAWPSCCTGHTCAGPAGPAGSAAASTAPAGGKGGIRPASTSGHLSWGAGQKAGYTGRRGNAWSYIHGLACRADHTVDCPACVAQLTTWPGQ